MIPLAYDLETFKESDFGYLVEKENASKHAAIDCFHLLFCEIFGRYSAQVG
jgi:hypothetical protein